MIRDESSGALLGRSLGTGLGEGLAALIDSKMKAVKRSNFADLLGRSGYGDKGEILAELAERNPAKFNELLMNLNPEDTDLQSEGVLQQFEKREPIIIPQLQKPDMSQLLNILKNNPGSLKLQGLATQGNLAQQDQSPIEQEIQQVKPKKNSFAQEISHQRIREAQEKRLLDQQEKIAQHRGIQEKKAQDQAAHKETKAYYDELIKKEKSAEQDDIRLGRLEKLVKNGKLPNSAAWSVLTKLEDTGIGTLATAGAAIGGALGLAGGPLAIATSPAAAGIGGAIGGGIGAVVSPVAGAIKTLVRSTSPDIEEFEKLSTDFVKNAKQYFGSRLTDADLKAFMSTIPSLMQTDPGKLKVINNLREFNKISKTEARLARQIIRANGGLRPPNLDALVHDALAPEIDKLAQQFSQ